MKSSAMRDLMAITERPEVISLAGGLPDTSTFPAETLAALLAKVAASDSARALQYGPTEGMAAVGRRSSTVMAAEGMHVDPDDVLVTTGGQQVIDLVCKTLVDPGDVIVAEAPTYPGAVPAFSAYQADVVQIAMDDDGMRVDELEATLDRLEREGRRPKFIYTIPTFQNPAGVTMSLPRRRRLVQVARERELLVLEDNPYGLLRYEGEALPTLRSLDGGDFVIYLGTFSKILSPGIRLGWTVAPAPVLEKMNLGKQASDLCSSSLSQLFVAAYFAEGHWQDYIATLRDLYRRRRDAMLDALAEHLPPEAAWTHPAGGLFIWATLPDYIDTTDLLALGAVAQRGLRPRARGVPRRPRRLVDAAELLRRRRRRHPRGRAADRRGRARAGRAVRHADRQRAPGRGRAGARARRSRAGRRAAPAAARRSRRAREAPRSDEHASPCSRAGARWSARSRCARAPASRTRSSAWATR